MIRPRFALSLAFALSPLALQAEAANSLDGSQLMDRYAETQSVESELAFIEMKVFEPDAAPGEITKRRFLGLTQKDGQGGFSYLVRMVRPQDIEGLSVLTTVNGDDAVEQWLYLPAKGEPVRLAGASRSGSFLGSDFTFEDLVREVPGNHRYTRLPDGVAQGEQCAVVRATPEDGASSQYAYRDLYLDPNTFEVRKIEFFDASGAIIKELQAYEYRSPDVEGTTVRPRFAVMTNRETGTISVFKVLKSRLNFPLGSEWFDASKLATQSPADVNGLLVEIDVLGIQP